MTKHKERVASITNPFALNNLLLFIIGLLFLTKLTEGKSSPPKQNLSCFKPPHLPPPNNNTACTVAVSYVPPDKRWSVKTNCTITCPTKAPVKPTKRPTRRPTHEGATPEPTKPETKKPTPDPTPDPTVAITKAPVKPSKRPTRPPHPTPKPTRRPTCADAQAVSVTGGNNAQLRTAVSSTYTVGVGLIRFLIGETYKYCVGKTFAYELVVVPADCVFKADKVLPIDSLQSMQFVGDRLVPQNNSTYPAYAIGAYPQEFLTSNSQEYNFVVLSFDRPLSGTIADMTYMPSQPMKELLNYMGLKTEQHRRARALHHKGESHGEQEAKSKAVVRFRVK